LRCWRHVDDSASTGIGAADAEGTQVVLGQVEHADDVRREDQDDVGLDLLGLVAGKQAAEDRNVAQPGMPPILPRRPG
jgi:hypothetical protein